MFAGTTLGLALAAVVVASLNCNMPVATESRDDGTVGSTNPVTGSLGGLSIHSEPDSRAMRTVASWQSSRPEDAALIERMARTPQGTWFNGWQPDPGAAAATLTRQANDRGAVPVIVVYNIPNRDCGLHSSGGAASASAYASFVRSIADGIRGKKAIVIMEPDAVSAIDCMASSARAQRYAMISDAVRTLSEAGAWVYIDAGHYGWHSEAEIAARMREAGVQNATGFALNVSNFVTTSNNIRYGDGVSALLGGKHYVIDTSRNGLGPAGE